MMTTIESQPYEPVELTKCPSPAQCARVRQVYEMMILAGVQTLLDRVDRRPNYGFVDTKFSLVDGHDFDPADPLRGQGTIYGWIQGRALEALAGHRAWLKRTDSISAEQRHNLDARLKTLLTRLVRNLEDLRRRQQGRLSFAMTTDGRPLRIVDCREVVRCESTPGAPANFTDLFYAKGLAAAAASLGDPATLQVARQMFDWVAQEIEDGRFVSDQQQLDPGNAGIRPMPGRYPYSPRMIALGATALLHTATQEDAYRRLGVRLIEHVLRHYVNTDGQVPAAPPFSVWEYVDDRGRPYVEAEGVLRSLPGHATEFVGLALKHLRVSGAVEPGLQQLLAQTLQANFQNGLAANQRGIVHSVDLMLRKVLNVNMPWWPLPETIRAAIECRHFQSANQWKPVARIAMQCSNAFLRYYVRPEVHWMAVQALDGDGQVATVIPAVPDADPCYHTGLSMIDVLEVWGEAM